MPVGCRFGGAGRPIPPKMDLLEYQGKELFARHGLPVPAGRHAATAEQAVAAGAVMAYSFAVAFLIAFALKKTVGIRISPDDEEKGIDAAFHREASYELASV